ncbi:MAG TPA: hypothetical protein VF761_14500 [Gemmatimonadaceae bacterium]
MKWRFSPDAEAGAMWLQNPDVMYVYVDYTVDGNAWRRLMVATARWLNGHLAGVSGPDDHSWAVVPTMLVLPSVEGSKLRTLLDQAISEGGLDVYSTPA